MFKRQSTKEVIEEIHNSFNTAGDKLLAGALEVLNQVGQTTIEKAERLKKAGFTMASEVQKAESIKVSKELAERIQYYQQKYPLNKFITEEQVKIICDKYALVCAPVDRYKGFVPETKLKMIEGFKLNDNDRVMPLCINPVFSSMESNSSISRIKEKYKDGVYPILKSKGLWASFEIDGVGVNSFDKIDNTGLHICAPSKDMDLKGLKKVGSVFTSYMKVTVPDPVVLQPCKDGYLIVAAWGDEASDPIVVNPIQN